MKNSHFSYELIIIIIATSLITSMFPLTLGGTSLVYATTSLDQSIQQNQQDLQSTINKEVQQTITDTISNINNNSNLDSNRIGSNNSQTQDTTASLSSFQQKASVIDSLPSQKVKVGDIDIAYKMLGDGNRTMVLITGLGATMDMWSPYLLSNLTTSPNDYRVIIFDNRGAGESTIGTKGFSINQFVNDTVGLLDALSIEKTDILGWSMGAFIAQELAAMNPDRVDDLILYASSCGGPDAVPPTSEVIQTFSNTSLSPEQLAQESISLMFPTQWFEANPNYLNYFPIPTESVSPEVMGMQTEALENWSGNCQILGDITSPTLIIVGTDDFFTPAENSVTIVEKIPGAWLVQIRNAGHGLMYQYPETFTTIVETYLNGSDKDMR